MIFRRQRGRESKGVVCTTTLIARSKFNPYPGHVVASLDKAFYDDYLCMVASNMQQIQWAVIQKIHRNIANSKAGADQARRQDWVTGRAEINFGGAREVYLCEFEGGTGARKGDEKFMRVWIQRKR